MQVVVVVLLLLVLLMVVVLVVLLLVALMLFEIPRSTLAARASNDASGRRSSR